MIEFSSTLASRGLPTVITYSADLDALMAAFTSVVNSLRFWEYNVLDVDAPKSAIHSALASSSSTAYE